MTNIMKFQKNTVYLPLFTPILLSYEYHNYNFLQKLDVYAFQMLNGNGDMLDMLSAVKPDSLPDFTKMSKVEITSYIAQNGHCSALVKARFVVKFEILRRGRFFIQLTCTFTLTDIKLSKSRFY